MPYVRALFGARQAAIRPDVSAWLPNQFDRCAQIAVTGGQRGEGLKSTLSKRRVNWAAPNQGADLSLSREVE
jgi:hypothetical protein